MTEDEQLSPTFEEMILATVLGLVDARLPRHVRDRYLHLIGRKRSLMDYLAEILDRVPLFLAELENGFIAAVSSNKGDPDQQHARSAAIQTKFFLLIIVGNPDLPGSLVYKKGNFFMYDIQHCFVCRPSDSTVSEGAAEIVPRTVASTALAVRRSNHLARSHPLLS
jgi:hypothetical protein